MENKMSFNLIREFIIYTARNKKAWEAIDELYYENYNECVEMADKLNDFLNEFNIDIKSESIEATCYIKRLSSLFMLSDEYMLIIIEKAFSKAYKYVISNKTVKISSYMNRKLPKSISNDDLLSEFLAVVVFAMNYDNRLDKNDTYYYSLIQLLYQLRERELNGTNTGFKYDKSSKQRQKLINELELILRGRYYSDGYNTDGMHEFLEAKKCFDRINRTPNIDKIKNNVLYKIYCSTEYTDFLVDGGFNANELLQGIEIEKKLVKDVINTYLLLSGYEENVEVKKEDIDIDEMATYVSISLLQLLFLEKYRESHEFFFKNYNENSNARYKELLNEVRDVKKNNLKLQDENEKVKLENEELKRRLSKLEKELEKSKTNNKELFELRNYIFNNQEDETNIIEENINLKYLECKKAVCFGGNKAWISSMSKEFDWAFVPADAINFDAAILKDADIVFIKATHISHAMYYKVIANLGEETEIKFINNNNITRIKEELSNV